MMDSSQDASPCLVIGASGFIGRNLIEVMADQGRRVRALSREGRPLFFHENVEWVTGDLSDPESLESALIDCGSCVQLATTTKPATADADVEYDIDTNLTPNVRLLKKLVKRGGIKFVFISSGGTVYGEPLTVPIVESHPTDPLSSYGIIKLAVEKYVALYARLYGLEATILRVSNPFGPYQSFSGVQGVVSTFMWKVLNGEPVEIWGTGMAVRDYLYVRDVCDAIIRSLDYEGEKRVFNIGLGKGMSVLEVLDAIQKVTGARAEVKHIVQRSSDVSVSILDCSLAKNELNWEARTPFLIGLQNTMEWIVKCKDDG